MISNRELVEKFLNEGWSYTFDLNSHIRPPGIHSVIDKDILYNTLFRLVYNFGVFIYICENDVKTKAERKLIVDKSKIWIAKHLIIIFRDGDSLIWRYGSKELVNPDVVSLSFSREEREEASKQGYQYGNKKALFKVKKLFGVKK